jgi:mono/diheme cytochrome c family protein
MKAALKVAALTLAATAFYAYVGHMVPQTVTYPPEEVALNANMTTEEMVKAGEEIVATRGTCLSCHTIGADKPGRFPDLGGIGARAGSRKPGMSDVDYLAESLYEPNAYIVDGFNPGMISASKPPVSLSDAEILAVIAYLQSLGGKPTVTMNTKLKYQGQSPPPAASGARAAIAAGTPLDGPQLFQNHGCATCHNIDKPETLVGPSLYDVGKRLSTPQLYESIMDPDATLAKGFPPGLMIATLRATQFYDKVSAGEIKALVEYLASRKGNG